MLDLYYWPTPNGKKVTILFEECGLPYTIKPVRIAQGDQFTPEFLKISPNNRMPALVDTEPKSGKPVAIFESGAIMMYVAEKVGRFYPQETRKRYDVIQWIMWQMANQGPKLGEQGHFHRVAASAKDGDFSYALTRFDNEAHRLYGVMNLGLFNKEWLAADEYTIADMICYPWAATLKIRGFDIGEFPNVKRWLDAMAARPAVEKGMVAGADLSFDPSKLSDEERARVTAILTNQRATPIPKEWGAA